MAGNNKKQPSFHTTATFNLHSLPQYFLLSYVSLGNPCNYEDRVTK